MNSSNIQYPLSTISGEKLWHSCIPNNFSESGFNLSPVSFQPSPYLRLLESHTRNETHEHSEIQSNYKNTEIPSSYQASESRPRSPHIPFKVLQSDSHLSSSTTHPSDSPPSFAPALGGTLHCLQKLEEEVSQVNAGMHGSKPVTFLKRIN